MQEGGFSAESIARRVVLQRNSQKLEARGYMTASEVSGLAAGNIKRYGDAVGPTPDQMFDKVGDWNTVISKSMQKDPEINMLLGLQGPYTGVNRLIQNPTPTLFGNKFPEHQIDNPKIVPNDRLSNVSGKFNYVIQESGSLVIGKTGHTSLTGGAPVQAAGEIKVVNGSVKSVDNASGHFQPVGGAIESITKNAFNNIGIDTSGKFIFKEWVVDPSLPRGGKWTPVKK